MHGQQRRYIGHERARRPRSVGRREPQCNPLRRRSEALSMVRPALSVHHTGLDYEAVPRLQECCRQFEAEVVSISRNKVHQTWEQSYSRALYEIEDKFDIFVPRNNIQDEKSGDSPESHLRPRQRAGNWCSLNFRSRKDSKGLRGSLTS